MTRIQPATLNYLKKLTKNNDRDWFKANRAEYDDARANMAECADAMIIGLAKDDVIETPTGAKALYRIHRDVRFSKDKTPYTGWFSGYFRRGGQERRGGYYFRIQPGDMSLLGGGFWGPNKEDLLHIRHQIEMDDEPLREVIESKVFKKHFAQLEGEQLKTAPKGFDKAHPSIDLLRYKQFLATRAVSDKEVTSAQFIEQAIETHRALRPFFEAMSMYLTTDLNGESTL